MKTNANRWKSMTIDNHTNLDDRLLIDYQYQSINWHRLLSIGIDCHRSSISSIGYVLVYESSQHYPLKENIDLTVITFSTCILKWKGVFYFQMYLVFSYLKENTHLSMITFVHIVSRKTLCLFGEHWYHVLFLLHCHYTTRRICGIKQGIIVAFFCWLPIMFTLFPSLAIPSFLQFSHWGITFTQCATKGPAINCYYKHQSSSLLLVLLFLKLTSQHFSCYKQLLVLKCWYNVHIPLVSTFKKIQECDKKCLKFLWKRSLLECLL